MNDLQRWAEKHGVVQEALADLPHYLYPPGAHPPLNLTSGGEAGVQARLALESSARGWRLWRNNSGAAVGHSGRPVRYGLGNVSKKVCDRVKSADLVGIRPVLITAGHVGTTIGQFASIEAKSADRPIAGSAHLEAQQRWARIVESLGGYAKITQGEL